MYLLLDLGNTNLDVGVYSKSGELICKFKTHADLLKSSEEYATILDQFLTYYKLEKSNFDGVILSSVVPSLNNVITQAVKSLINKDTLVVSKGIKTSLLLQIDNPNELGSDLICDAVGGINLYPNKDLIIVDLGTCIKVLYITKTKQFKGVIIQPGLQLQKEALIKKTAQLYDTNLIINKQILGKNTPQSISSGLLYGSYFAIKGFEKEIIKEEKPIDLVKIITGGDAHFLSPLLKDYNYLPDLIFTGLYNIYLKNTERNN